MQPLTVAMPENSIADLERIAVEQRRRPKDQAAVMLIEAIAQARNGSAAMNQLIREKTGRSRR